MRMSPRSKAVAETEPGKPRETQSLSRHTCPPARGKPRGHGVGVRTLPSRPKPRRSVRWVSLDGDRGAGGAGRRWKGHALQPVEAVGVVTTSLHHGGGSPSASRVHTQTHSLTHTHAHSLSNTLSSSRHCIALSVFSLPASPAAPSSAAGQLPGRRPRRRRGAAPSASSAWGPGPGRGLYHLVLTAASRASAREHQPRDLHDDRAAPLDGLCIAAGCSPGQEKNNNAQPVS